jgi:hypothetical protein
MLKGYTGNMLSVRHLYYKLLLFHYVGLEVLFCVVEIQFEVLI